MPRREPPSQLKLIPWTAPTPPRGAAKYSLPCAPQPLLLPSRPVRSRSYTLDSTSSTHLSSDTPVDGSELRGRELVRGTTDTALAALSRTSAQGSARDRQGSESKHAGQQSMSSMEDVQRGRDKREKIAPWLKTSRLADEEVERAVRGLTAPREAVTAR